MIHTHLKVPSHWKHYWTKYPEGYTILEALLNWVNQVNAMTDNLNDMNERLDEFIQTFEADLQETVRIMLEEWKDNGVLEDIINEAIVTANKNLEERGINVLYPPPTYVAATGDGSTDDYLAIQALLNDFKHVYFPKDHTFYVSQPLRPKAGTTIEGSGTIKGIAGLDFAMVVQDVDGFTCKGVNFTISGLQVYESTNIDICGSKFYGIIDRPALEVAGVKSFKIHHNTIIDNRMGIHIINSNTGVVTDNLVENIGGGRLNGSNETALGQIAILLWGNSGHEAGSEKATHHVTVSNNVCRNGSDNGIRLTAEKYHIAYGENTGRCHDCTVTGNVVEEFYVDGIRATCDYTTITGNTVKNCSYGGIRGNGCVGLTITDNVIQGDSESRFGINIGLVHENSSGERAVIANNLVYGATNGISVFGGTQPTTGTSTEMYDVTVKGNQVYEAGEVGITLYKCLGAIVSDNLVKECGGTGIDCGGSYITIVGNKLEGNVADNHETYKYGISANASYSSIHGNHVFNQTNGIGIVQKGQHVQYYGNLYHDNTQDENIFSANDYLPVESYSSMLVGRKPSTTVSKDGLMYFDGNTLRLYVGGEWKYIPLTSTLTVS